VLGNRCCGQGYKLRKADPYKGKGLRLAGEIVRRKQGKTGKK